MADTPDALDQLVHQIVGLAKPLRVILFGSTARGAPSPDSDLDVLVVMPEGTHCRRTAQFLYQHIRNVGRPMDILVATPAMLERHKNSLGLIYRTILEEGKEVYVAGQH